MLAFLSALVLAVQPAPPTITMSPIPLEIRQQTALRCSVAIAMAAEQQRMGSAEDKSWPDLTTRGREYFVRSMAQLMDETGATREGIALYARPEVEALKQPGRLAEVMPACLVMLDASGL